MNTLILESNDYSLKALAVFRSLGNVYLYSEMPFAHRNKALSNTNVLVVRLGYKIDKNWLDKMPNLKIIASPTTGLNHIDLEETKKRKIKVISLKGRVGFLKNITSTAEEALALIFALTRNIPWAFDDVKRGQWDREEWKGHQLLNKKIGLLGCGRLGKIVARYCRALKMNILGYDPFVSNEAMRKNGIKRVGMNDLFKQSDIVSLHISLGPKTDNLIKERHFKMMKPTAYFINTSRGEIIDENALLKALKNKWIAGAALDVMKNEIEGKHLKRNPLLQYAKMNNNLLIVPHIGGATYEAMHITEEFITDLVEKAVRGK